MWKLIRVMVVCTVVTMSLFPYPAYACSGWIDCWLGFTERVEVRADRDAELARIQAERDQQIANVEALAVERVTQAEAEVERVRQLRFENEAQRDIAIAQAQAQADEYRAMVSALSSEKIAGINADAETQIVALQEAAKVHIEGITQTGLTERFRIVGGWTFAVIALLVIGGLLRILSQRQRELIHEVRMMPVSATRQLADRRPTYIELRRHGGEVVRYEED